MFSHDETETQLFEPVAVDDVVRMHGRVWRVNVKCLVRIVDLSDPEGFSLAESNWRSDYVGAFGQATFADDDGQEGLSIGQIRHLSYPDGDGLRVTNDILRTSSGMFEQTGSMITLTTHRTRYVFEVIDEEEADRINALIALGS